MQMSVTPTPVAPAPAPPAHDQIAYLQHIVAIHDRKLQTSLVHENFWHRAFAVLGHVLAIQAILFGGFMVLSFLFGAMLFGSY
jgi:hypothetical protein